MLSQTTMAELRLRKKAQEWFQSQRESRRELPTSPANYLWFERLWFFIIYCLPDAIIRYILASKHADNTETNHNDNYHARLESDWWADSSWAGGLRTGL